MRAVALYLDHVFITCDSGAPEADALIGHGLLEGSGNVHPGQGTANRRFFFSNFMVELLWVCNVEEAASAAAEPAQLWRRWTGRATGASRLGLLCGGTPPAHLPTRAYQPAYLPQGRAIEAARDIALDEPALFFLPWVNAREPGPEPTAHSAGVREITGVALGVADPARLSAPLRSLSSAGLLEVFASGAELLEIRYRSESPAVLDCRPRLPLVFRGMR